MEPKPTTVAAYLAALPPERRAAIEAVRKVVLANLDKDFEEGIQYGMIGYYVPHRVYPAGYHCDPKQPLPFASLGSQKNHMALYLMCIYADAEAAARFREAWAKAGKKLDMGKACIRFKKLDDLALDVIGEAIKSVPAREYIRRCEMVTGARNAPAKKAPTKTAKAPKPSTASNTEAAPRKRSKTVE
jgi:hypothetical protein